MNYLIAIDQEIAELETRLSQLRIARGVLVRMSKIVEPKPKVSRPNAKGKTRNLGAADRARKHIVEYLMVVNEPVKANMILQMLLGHNIKDTTMWSALKDLRNDDIISWDKDARLYTMKARKENAA